LIENVIASVKNMALNLLTSLSLSGRQLKVRAWVTLLFVCLHITLRDACRARLSVSISSALGMNKVSAESCCCIFRATTMNLGYYLSRLMGTISQLVIDQVKRVARRRGALAYFLMVAGVTSPIQQSGPSIADSRTHRRK
jgi:hypothetical protein